MLSLRKQIYFLIITIIVLLTGCSGDLSKDDTTAYKINSTVDYKITDKAVINPFMGYAIDATDANAVGENSLVYIDITFKELQPDNATSYAFQAIDESNNINLWKEQGKHAVLRFICDSPSNEAHSDIPDWLMSLTGDGTHYNTSYGKGYSPDYSNEVFIEHHKKAIAALAEHYDDGFVSYVQLGSIGHWGEWHVKNDEGVINIPLAEVRQRYIAHYVQEFSNAKLLMLQPFSHAKGYKTGLYNNMIGAQKETQDWLDKIENGGYYYQTGEEKALVAMKDFWKTSPSGGELTGSFSAQTICTSELKNTIEQLKESHTTFIGPNTPLNALIQNPELKDAVDQIGATLGYRIGITKVTVRKPKDFEHIELKLQWENAGIAPAYFEMPVALYVQNANGEFEKIADVQTKLHKLLPGDTDSSTTIIPESAVANSKALYIGITDSTNDMVSVKLVSDQPVVDNYTEIYKF